MIACLPKDCVNLLVCSQRPLWTAEARRKLEATVQAPRVNDGETKGCDLAEVTDQAGSRTEARILASWPPVTTLSPAPSGSCLCLSAWLSRLPTPPYRSLVPALGYDPAGPQTYLQKLQKMEKSPRIMLARDKALVTSFQENSFI